MNNKIRYLTDQLKQTFSLKRMKFTLYIVMVLWLAFGTQTVMNQFFHEKYKITEAFVKTDAQEMQSSIEAVAECKSEYLSEDDKKGFIRQIAEAIGLEIDKDISIIKDDDRIEYSFAKRAKQATSEIKVISLEQKENSAVKVKNYIIVRLTILKSVQSIDKYKSILENSLEHLGFSEQQITMQYKGCYDGEVSKKEKEQIVKKLVEALQGKVAVEYDEGDLYTAYAYTGLLEEYIISNGSKVNIQVAIAYNKVSNKTTVYLATPIINQNW